MARPTPHSRSARSVLIVASASSMSTLSVISSTRFPPSPPVELAARLLEDPLTEREDEPGLLGEGDELRGQQQAVLLVAEAHEGLEAENGAARDVDLGLGE